MIFVVFFVPLALYLLVLGYINRQPRPVVVSGTWDFLGILFALSGFLFCGGPAVLSSLNERWRFFWLLGDKSSFAGLGHVSQIGQFLALSYFIVVVGGSVLMFWRQRALTSIYNAEPAVVQRALIDSCARLGLDPIRSGDLLVFGLSMADGTPEPAKPEGIQAPHHLPQLGAGLLAEGGPAVPGDEFLGQNAILAVESFDAFKHVTLRWEPHDSPLRPVLEAALSNQLAQAEAPEHDTGLWLTLVGFGLLCLSVLIVFALVLRSLLGY